MRTRLGLVSALTAGAVASVIGLAAVPPASAATAPTAPEVTMLDSSTPGHVTGTVTSDQPYVYVRLASNVPATLLTLAGGTADFDLETWGYGAQTALQAVACRVVPPGPSDCSPVSSGTYPFEPTDLLPQVTWPADTTIGPGQSASVAVSDPGGGGNLRAFWGNNGDDSPETPLPHNGSATLNLSQGEGTVYIARCAAASTFNCTYYVDDVAKDFRVRLRSAAELVGPSPVTQLNPTTGAYVATDRTGTYTLNWHLEQDGQAVAGYGSSSVSGTLGEYGVTPSFPVGVLGLADGGYDVVGTITVTEPEFGTYPAAPFQEFLWVHRNGPDVDTLTSTTSTLYPEIRDARHPASTQITATGDFIYSETIEIRNAAGSTVRHLEPAFQSQSRAQVTWDGTDDEEIGVSPGTYTVVVLDTDENVAARTATIKVSDQQLVLKTFRLPITAKASLATRTVGRCSTLSQPSKRRWAGSLGYYANTRCASRAAAASAVTTSHRAVLPAADSYLDIRLATYGGAARAKQTSKAALRYRTAQGRWSSSTVLTRALGTHNGPAVSAAGMVAANRTFSWGVTATAGNRYDVGSFTLVVRYYVLG